MHDKTGARSVRGCILWEGPSRFTGRDVIAIATFHSRNEKTGPMVQTWILCAELDPVEAVRLGQDEDICGMCLHRGDGQGHRRSCYVNLIQAPLEIYRSYHRGIYPIVTAQLLMRHVYGRGARLGAYGDPCAVPIPIWHQLLRYASGHTGYTHTWDRPANQCYRPILMASCDSAEQRKKANRMGWRVFRVRNHDDPILPGEVVCPASPEGQYRRTCDTCRACDGYHGRAGQSDVVIIGHGRKNFEPILRRNLQLA